MAGRPLLVFILLCVVWGSTWLFIKTGLEDLPPFTFAAVRFVIAPAGLLVLMRLRRIRFPRGWQAWRFIAVTGMLTFALNYGLVFWAELHISAGLAAILYCTMPGFGLIFAHFMVREEALSWLKAVGVILSFAGVVVIFFDQVQVDDRYAFFGSAAIVLASVGTAMAATLVKLHGKTMPSLALTTGQMLVGLGPLLVLGLVLEGNPLVHNWTVQAWIAVLYLAILGSAMTFWLLNWLIKHVEVTITNLIPLGSTLVTVVLGKWFLDESLRLQTFFGGAMILVGMLISTKRRRRPPMDSVFTQPATGNLPPPG